MGAFSLTTDSNGDDSPAVTATAFSGHITVITQPFAVATATSAARFGSVPPPTRPSRIARVPRPALVPPEFPEVLTGQGPNDSPAFLLPRAVRTGRASGGGPWVGGDLLAPPPGRLPRGPCGSLAARCGLFSHCNHGDASFPEKIGTNKIKSSPRAERTIPSHRSRKQTARDLFFLFFFFLYLSRAGEKRFNYCDINWNQVSENECITRSPSPSRGKSFQTLFPPEIATRNTIEMLSFDEKGNLYAKWDLRQMRRK